MDSLAKGWFSELGPMWKGQCLSLEVEELLFDQKSEYQHIVAFKSKTYGNVLVLDGVIQATERDEFSYQEMIVNLPMCAHPKPEKVLVIGGGDGGVLREITRHECVAEVTICEIDSLVIETAKKYLPCMAEGFDDPRLTIFQGDGFEFLKEHKNTYDVIIVDSSDPVGPAESLFQEDFYRLLKESLNEGGIACTQGECMWLHLDLIKDLNSFSKKLFKSAEYAYTTIPTYPSGQIGFMVCSKQGSCKKPARSLSESHLAKLKYYSPEMHEASFILPPFAKRALAE